MVHLTNHHNTPTSRMYRSLTTRSKRTVSGRCACITISDEDSLSSLCMPSSDNMASRLRSPPLHCSLRKASSRKSDEEALRGAFHRFSANSIVRVRLGSPNLGSMNFAAFFAAPSSRLFNVPANVPKGSFPQQRQIEATVNTPLKKSLA
jgi:hypothetical protein